MNAHVVDFSASDNVGADAQVDGYTGDEGNQFLRFGGSHTNMPFFPPAGGFECPVNVGKSMFSVSCARHGLPVEKGGRVVESELSVIILDIVALEQLLDFIQLQRSSAFSSSIFHCERISTCPSSIKSIVTHSNPCSIGGGSFGTLSGSMILIGPSSTLPASSRNPHQHATSSRKPR